MKRIKVLGIVFLAVIIGLGSCDKEGPAGPQGPQGEQGKPGEQGPRGLPGVDGSIIYSGTDQPTADIGQAGDFYIDLVSGALYGPKTEKGWGDDPLILKGEKGDKGATGSRGDKGDKGDKGDTGAPGLKGDKGEPGQDGQDGSRILSGTSGPTAEDGKTGDYYWDISNYKLYGPKTSSGWGTGIVLRGPKGEKGEPGEVKVINSGWFSIGESGWEKMSEDGSGNQYVEPGDKSTVVAYNDPYKVKIADGDGAILCYVNDGHGISLAPGMAAIKSVAIIHHGMAALYEGTVEFRFVITKSQEASLKYYYVIPVVALKTGVWDWKDSPSEYINKTYLPALKWKVIVVPASQARRSSPPPDPSDYEATCAYYGISE